MQSTRILAIRHGETAWNRDTRIQGQTDIPLSELGHWQASRLAQALEGEPIDAVYSSDLQRARQTAEPIARAQGLALRLHPALRERHFGEFEGRTWAELEAHWPEQAQAWRKRDPNFAPLGGENLLQLRERVVGAVLALAADHQGEQIVVVAHGGVLDTLYRAATRVDLQAPRTWELRNAAINRLLWSPEGLSLVGWADAQHLQQDGGDEISS